MSDNDLTKISTSLLPIEDIIALLHDGYDFITKADKASDVEKVAGVDAEYIAVAVDPKDRTTVRNALNLEEHPAAFFLPRSEGDRIEHNAVAAKVIHETEFRDLRDELYQLRMELAKAGVVTDYKPYAGYHDLFRTNAPVHEVDILATSIEDSANHSEIILDDSDFAKFDEGDWIVLHITDMARYHVAKIIEKSIDGQTLKFTPSTSYDLKAKLVNIYKSIGENINGAFCFLEKETLLPDSVEMHSCLDDDTFRLRRQIKNKNTGFAYTFRIPDAQKGFLVKFDIQAKTYGAPGSLMCYIIDELNIDKWKNPVQAAAEGILLAKSQPLNHDASYGERIVSFSFWDGIRFPLLNEPDTIERKIRYCAIIEALDADSSNYYDIVFLQNKREDGTRGDLQLNNITYLYERKEDSSLELCCKTDAEINASDLYYGLVTRGVVNNGFVPYREGVYSAKFSTHEPIEISRARLMLRIAREGYYTTNLSKAIAYEDNSAIPVKKAEGLTYNYDMSELGGFGLQKDEEDVIIGTTIRRIANQNSSEIIIKKGLYTEPGQPVYRAGYEATLKAKRIEWDTTKCRFITTDQVRIQLPLVSVMPDQHKKDIRISDRLIYEGDYLTEDFAARYFNDFELQLYWHTEYSGMYEDSKYKADFVGRIHDLTISMDRTI